MGGCRCFVQDHRAFCVAETGRTDNLGPELGPGSASAAGSAARERNLVGGTNPIAGSGSSASLGQKTTAILLLLLLGSEGPLVVDPARGRPR
jgi:hypothetical protein